MGTFWMATGLWVVALLLTIAGVITLPWWAWVILGLATATSAAVEAAQGRAGQDTGHNA